MLQDIRKSTQGTTAKVIIGLIVLAFAFWGVESILLGGSSSAVAEVNGEAIEPGELQQAVSIEQRRLIAAMGDNFDPAMLEDQAVSQRAMAALISRKLLIQSAESMGLHISDAQLGAVIGNMEQFQVDGQFSEQMYRAMLAESGYSPASFRQAMIDDLLASQARTGLAASDFATPAELALAAAIVEEQRDIKYLTVPLTNFQIERDVDDAEVEAFYQAQLESFRSPETVELDYIELRKEDFAQPVSEQALEIAYQQEIAHGEYQSQSRVSHILLSQAEGESDTDYQKRIAEVEAALAAGDDFAALAERFSDDIGSSAAGGDLGFTGGDVFPEPMEEAIAQLGVGETSAAVVTDAGTHFIKLTEQLAGKAPSLEELRPELEERLSMETAGNELLVVVESLKDLSFNAENLNMPAQELELEVQHSAPVSRQQASGLFANQALLAAAFSEDVLNGGLNSDVIEVEPGHWVVLHVTRHRQPEILPLADVRERIVAEISEARARSAARSAAQSALQILRDGGAMDALANAENYEWQVELGVTRRNSTLPPALAAAAFRLQPPEPGSSQADIVAAPNGDFYVYQLNNVSPGSADGLPEVERQGLTRLVSGEFGQIIDTEYRQGLRDAAEIDVM